ncbi:MAG: DegV family protein [Clostridia bacterium]|nr:DegV family protein [Clostridia bacterium]
MAVKITSDSTCDLGELVEKWNIGIMPLNVILDTETYQDGVSITPKDIFAFVEKNGMLPKTSARSIIDYEEFFSENLKDADEIVHFSISSKSSVSHNVAKQAAEAFGGKVTVIDSAALSSGQGLLVMKGCELAAQGKSAAEIEKHVNALRLKVNTSFIPDHLDYLYKGGRCSKMEMYGANILKIHPMIFMEDGALGVKRKYRGSMKRCISNYIDDLYAEYPNYDKTRCFVTHSNADEPLVELAVKKVKEMFDFDEVVVTVAGSVITGHCGRNTLGVLFITK